MEWYLVIWIWGGAFNLQPVESEAHCHYARNQFYEWRAKQDAPTREKHFRATCARMNPTWKVPYG